ncbi:3-hydroxyacyl-CoA dehydrogenase [Sphingomonadaceae bacterium jetA1]|jgi:3-hydroxybutyryl-CoA dehydrogenase|uniref:3-hydroxyacyl-CoA dehydrogenase n=1 Tax=Facivitalis istanbulensis TaxID=3075838 RepID=UPI003499BCA2
MSAITTIVVAGSGVLGAQIAFQSAFHGKTVRVYDISDAAIDALDAKWQGLATVYARDLGATKEQTDAAIARLTGTTDLAQAAQGAQLVIEAVTEILSVKRDFFARLAEVADAGTIFATNSSTLAPSAIADATGRPDRFLALHFAYDIWLRNIGEVMGHPGTDPAVFEQVVAFARSIGLVPLILHKEQPAYIFNTLLVPWLQSALGLVANGVATFEDVDRTWMIAQQAEYGPFATLDMIGLRTPFNIVTAQAERGEPNAAAVAAWLKRDFIDQNRLGVETGHGFYHYPDPAYRDPSFLKP